jgi:hypothetical protein
MSSVSVYNVGRDSQESIKGQEVSGNTKKNFDQNERYKTQRILLVPSLKLEPPLSFFRPKKKSRLKSKIPA